jgi:hypothetical protein
MILSHLPNSARLWLFTASRPMEEDELQWVESSLNEFVSAWTSHGAVLAAGFTVLHKTIIAIAVDESAEAPSGCSIDKAFRLLAECGEKLKLDFLNRLLLVKPYCNIARVFNQNEATEAYHSGGIGAHDLVLNPALATLGQLRDNYLQPFSENWIGKKLIQHTH